MSNRDFVFKLQTQGFHLVQLQAFQALYQALAGQKLRSIDDRNMHDFFVLIWFEHDHFVDIEFPRYILNKICVCDINHLIWNFDHSQLSFATALFWLQQNKIWFQIWPEENSIRIDQVGGYMPLGRVTKISTADFVRRLGKDFDRFFWLVLCWEATPQFFQQPFPFFGVLVCSFFKRWQADICQRQFFSFNH